VNSRFPILLRIPRTLLPPAVAWLFSASRLLAQCAMCSGAVGAGADAGRAYNSSTVFMLAVPYLLLLGVLGYVVHAFRRPPAKADVAGSDLSSDAPPASP
jgi:hypothetical protein